MNENQLLREIKNTLDSSADRTTRVRLIAELVRLAGNYRWVGIYDVGPSEIAVIAWSGIGAPAHPRFPVTQGLSGHAVSTQRVVISNDVENDPRYLTAFSNTQSEIILPVINPKTNKVVGTLDVESEMKGAFGDRDREWLEKCADTMKSLWV